MSYAFSVCLSELWQDFDARVYTGSYDVTDSLTDVMLNTPYEGVISTTQDNDDGTL
ncbi:unnamed protein product [Absidia cylindrospora]